MLFFVLILLLGGGAGVAYVLRSSARNGSPLSISSRLGRFGLVAPSPDGSADGDSDQIVGAGRQRQQQSAVSRSVEKAIGRGKFAQKVFVKLDRAQLKMTPAEFITLCLAIFVGGLALGLFVKGFLGMLVAGIIAVIGPWLYVSRRTKKRRKAFLEQLADMSQMMGNSMRAGFSVLQSLELVANEGPAPASEEFDRVVTEVKLGLSLEQALRHLQYRIPSEDLELMVVAIEVQRQIGGNLAEILMVISQTIRERVRFERDLRTLTAQARYSSWIITGLPVAVAIAINFMDRPYESFLYTTTMGNFMIGTAVVMLSMGFFFLNKIASIEV